MNLNSSKTALFEKSRSTGFYIMTKLEYTHHAKLMMGTPTKLLHFESNVLLGFHLDFQVQSMWLLLS